MVIESKLIHFPTEQGFNYAINGATSSTNGLWGIVPDNALAFIDDTHEIWTHGHFYGAKSYLSNLSNGFIQVYNGTVKSTPSLNLWGRYLGPADSSVNGEITIREGAYTAYDSNGLLILDKWGMPTTVQSPAKINLMASGFALSSTGNVNNIGWHIKGPYYESTSNNNYSFSLTYTDASNSEKEYLTLDQYGAMTLSGQGFNVIGKTTVFGGSTTYGLLTSDPGGNIIAQLAYLQGAYLNNTSIVFITNKSTNSNWNAIQLYKRNALQTISNDVAYVTAKLHTSPATGWKPWITAASSEFDSWGIGLGGSSFWIGRVANNETENKLTHSWEFDKEGYISAVGYKVNGKDENYVLLGDGSTKPLSEIVPDIDISLITDAVNPGYVLAGPESGEKSAPLFRALVASDIPDLSATYLPLAGGTLTGPIEIKSTISGNYNEGLRITRAANNWAGITFGSTGLSGAPTNGWFVATTPDNLFIISPDSNSNTTGLTLNKDGDILWCNNKLWHSGNVTISDYVTLNTTLTITDLKIFTGGVQFKGSNEAHAIVTDNDANLVFDTLNNIVYTGDTSLLLATFKNGGNIYGTLTAVPSEEQGLYYNNHRLLTADNAFVDLYSNSEYLIAISIGNIIKKLSTSSIKSNLGLGLLAYKNSLTYTDVNAAASNHTHAYLPLAGGTMTGLIRRSYIVASTQPMIYAHAANNDVNLIRVGYSESTAGVAKLSADYGFTLRYLGTGNDNNNALQILADNQTGTLVIALSILQDGSTTFVNTVKATKFDGNATSATNATNVAISTKNDNVNYYLPFVSNTSGNLPLYVDNTDTGTLIYNPSTGTLTTTKFKGTLEGNANTATTATNATKIAVTADNTATEQYLVFVNGTSGNLAAHIDNTATGVLKYQPSTGTLSYQVASIGGNASVGGNLTVTGNTTIKGSTTLGDAAADSVTVNAYLNVASISPASSAIARPIWFSYAANADGYTVGRPAYHASFTYNPNTGTVVATKFSGALSGNATTASNLTDGSAQSRFGILYQSGASTTSATNPGASVTSVKYLGATTNANGAITPTWTSLDTTVTQNSSNLVTSGAVFSAIANKVAGAVQYLGTVATSADMVKLTAAGYGDFARVTSSFKIGDNTAHVGDIVILTSNAANGYATTTNWTIAHVEIDTNTWNAVSFTANGYVPMYSAANSTDSTSANTYHFLGYLGTAATSTTLKWYSLPANAFNNTNTWRSIVCDSNTATGTSTSSGVLKFVSGTNISLGWTNTSNAPTITVNHGSVTCTTTAAAAANSGTALSHSGEFVVPTAVTVSGLGHVTALTWTRYKLPASGNTDYTGIALKTNTTYGTKKTDTTLLKAASSTGLWIKGGTNKFLIGDGTNYIEVGVTPSIANNITGSGTSGNLAKFNGNNTITSGPTLSSAITSLNLSTKFLREDGTWAAPSYIANTHRVINVNGTLILKSNNTALNLVAGSYITLTAEKNASNEYTGKVTITSQDTWKAANTSQEGYVPKLQLATTNTIGTQNSEYVLTYKSGTDTSPVWRKLPTNAFKNDNTWNANALNVAGYVAAPTSSDGNKVWKTDANGNPGWRADNNDNTTYVLRAGASGVTTNLASDVNNPYINLRGSNNTNSLLLFKGSGTVSVKSNNGIITITGTNHITSLAYTAITGSSTTADMALVSTTTANKLVFKLLGSNAFTSTSYLPTAGGNMGLGAVITWPDDGNWGKSNSGVTFPYTQGGFSWTCQSDYVSLKAIATKSDNLELVLLFGDDNSNGLTIRNSTGTDTARITAAGAISATSFTGSLTGTATGNLTSVSYNSTNKKLLLTKNGTTTDVMTFGSNAFESHTIYDVATAVNGVSITLKNDGWVDACTINDKDTGTYAIQITETNSISSGVFSILKSGTDTEIDEIWLHTVNKASTSYHIFARVSGTKLLVACTAAGAKTLTIKIKRLI